MKERKKGGRRQGDHPVAGKLLFMEWPLLRQAGGHSMPGILLLLLLRAGIHHPRGYLLFGRVNVAPWAKFNTKWSLRAVSSVSEAINSLLLRLEVCNVCQIHFLTYIREENIQFLNETSKKCWSKIRLRSTWWAQVAAVGMCVSHGSSWTRGIWPRFLHNPLPCFLISDIRWIYMDI